ncbi:ATP-binding protein [Bacillus megaterium]|uniref:DUF6079 family protein n=1 Tax=Priestia megaterium TaxID=1404 RepID=UPI001292E765|nr:DUF6079 family protein [Priestia megaterium]MQR86862.1 ATP-binding protein [Priestia megaterium]
MLYKDLLQFDPIESIIKLTDANMEEHANNLLKTYVISERMAEQLNDLIIEQLQFNRMLENKGLFIVGNYGTGKSHLMSVISTIADREDVSQYITNSSVAKKAKEIEGQFKVIRLEFGGVKTPLRDILVHALEENLVKWGVDFTFPPVDKIINNKQALEEMMGLFNEKYPNHGLLLVIDELLDYLRGRREQELALDLGFLREIGEICAKTRFRFIAGIQEMLFGNTRFDYVAESLRRISERFVQVSIVRDDIAYVVSQRLLRKTDEQKSLIREHLKQFATLYTRLNEDIETYVNLFPIHPAYLTAFERVNIAEKRVALQTISTEIKKIIEKQLPEGSPGLISYDSYWDYIQDNATNRSDSNIREVINKQKTLKDRIENAFPIKKKLYQPMALRIINALSVYRLSTDDIYDKVGLTAQELRDDLFLHPAISMDFLLEEDDASEFLKTSIEATLKEVQQTVSYQYISANESNGQYYLDLKKDIDVDSLIQVQAETIEDDKLDRYFFAILQKAVELDENTHVSHVKIWKYYLPWEAHHVMRQGYLFFGAPNERSTAQPERDFYIYMLRPYDKVTFKDEHKPDEIFFEYNRSNEEFDKFLKLYAAAQDLARDASPATKKLYTSKVEEYQKKLFKWLVENFDSTFEITYRGKKSTVADLRMYILNNPTIKQIIDTSAEFYLTDWFEQKYEDYPSFGKIQGTLTKENMDIYIKKALQYINGEESKMGSDILNGFVLLDTANKISIKQSGYAKWILDLLEIKEHRQVINHSELIETISIKGTPDLQYTKQFHLEPELFVVLLGALISSGAIEVTIEGKTYNALNLNEYVQLPLNKLTQFSHIKKPTGLPIVELNAIANLFNETLPNYEEDTLTRVIVKVNEKANIKITEVLSMLQIVKKGIATWDGQLLNNAEIQETTNSLESFKEFCEGLKRYNTPAKMRNLKYDLVTIEQQNEAIDRLESLKRLDKQLKDISQHVNYLRVAQPNMGSHSEWSQRVEEVLYEIQLSLKQQQDIAAELLTLNKLKQEYIDLYIEAHDKSRLNAKENLRKNALHNDARLKALKELASYIPILPKEQIIKWEKSLSTLKTCYHVSEEKLQHTQVCTECKFRPTDITISEKMILQKLEEELPVIFENWTDTLLTNFNDVSIKENIALLTAEQQTLINEFINKKEFTLPIDIRLIQAINDLLKGIDKIEVSLVDIENMMTNGHPLTVEELRKRFEEMLIKKIGTAPTNRIRIMLKK